MKLLTNRDGHATDPALLCRAQTPSEATDLWLVQNSAVQARWSEHALRLAEERAALALLSTVELDSSYREPTVGLTIFSDADLLRGW